MGKDEFEKAKVSHNHGDLHKNGKWYWDANANDWRVIKKNKGANNSGQPATNAPASASTPAPTTQITSKKVGKPMDSQKLADFAKKAPEANLLKIVNSKNMSAQYRKIAYDELEERGYDMSKVDTSGNLDALFKMVGNNKGKNNAPTTGGSDEDDIALTNSLSDVDIDDNSDGGKDGDEITEKWYLNKEDARVKEKFNLRTKEGRIKYDKFVYKMKKKEKDYKNPVEVVQDLNEQYLQFLKNDEQRFMISAGGAGIGKSYGFNTLAELLNKRPFSEGDTPGDEDYHIFEAPEVNSGKQLQGILKAHNGKIILFDDNDKVLRRADCASVMKKATASTGKRIIGDPDDLNKNFEFTGRIIVLTNKDLSKLADNEDTKAIISRAMMVSEIYLTVEETIEVMESRYKDMEFPEAPRLDNKDKDDKERKAVMELIKKNKNNIDPANFSTRTFQEALNSKRKVESANEIRYNPAFAALIGSKMKNWEDVATATITKAVVDEFGDFNDSFEKGGCPEDDGVDYEVDNPKDWGNEDEIDSVEKAEDVLFDDKEENIFKSEDDGKVEEDDDDNMSLQKAETILFGE